MTKTYNITLVAPSSDSDDEAIRRIRAALKSLTRSFGLRCVRCEPAKIETEGK
jgi:hypothetical protein